LRAYCYPSRQNAPFGFGTMDVAALQVNESSNDRIITAAQGTLITDAVEAQLPESIWRNWRLLTVAARTQGGMSPPGYQPTSVALKYTLKPSASGESVADFDSGTLAATVSSHDENTLKVTASKSVAGVIAAGDRIVTCEAGVVTEGTVASVSSADIFLTDWPWDTGDGPTAGLQLQAGGGLTTDIRQAAIDLMDTLGPGKASSGSIDQSDPTDDGWDDTLRILRVQQAALECSDDLLDIDVTDLGGAGASDLTPTASATSTVYLITAGEIVVTEDAGDFS
jgi:hypothetical protein